VELKIGEYIPPTHWHYKASHTRRQECKRMKESSLGRISLSEK